MKQYVRKLAAALLVAPMMAPGGVFAKDPVYTSFFSNAGAGGYDVVAYFTEGQPVKGDRAFQTEYQGADWYFVSQENLDKFTSDPEAYAPQYGGYCAWAVSQGYTASGDPELWTVHEGKLYLNYNREINDRWLGSMEQFIVDADQNWPAVLD